MASTYVTYTGNGVLTSYSVTFPYISTEYVLVYVNDVLTTAYTWSSVNVINFTAAPANGAAILIRRVTTKTALVNWTSRTRLQSPALSLFQRQLLYVTEEAHEGYTDSKVAFEGALHTIDAAVATADASAVAANLSKVSAAASAATATSSAATASASQLVCVTRADEALVSKNAAAASATSATGSAVASAASQASASTSATNAATSATNASTDASSAATNSGLAATARTAAEAALASVLTAYDNFDDRYLGSKAANPTLDNDGNALVVGTLYFNSSVGEMRLWNGSAWVAAYVSASGFVSKTGDTMTGKFTTAASTATQAGLTLPNGVAPSSPVNGDLWTTSTDLVVRLNAATLNVAMLNRANAFTAGTKHTFSGDATTAGIRINEQAADPSSLANGDMWLNSTTHKLKTRINGATVTHALEGHVHALADVTNLVTSLAAKAALSQTDFISVLIELPTAKDYRVATKLPYGLTITEITTITTAGTATVTGKINTTALGGTANSASSTEQSQAHASANVAAAGDDIVLTVSAITTPANLSVMIKFTRTLV